MSEYHIPFHIQEEIMTRLPVKSVIRFKSVSKAWKSLIDSSEFISAHSHHRHTQPHHLLVGYEYFLKKGIKYISFMDDETLFQQRPLPDCPPYVKEDRHAKIVGISHGLVCFYCPYTNLAVIWNPSIRKSIVVALPNTPFGCERFHGFGVCPVTTDPKIVAITPSWDRSNTRYQCEVMVYSLSSRHWRRISTNLPTKPIHEWYSAVSADGFIYWGGGPSGDNMIISFDVTNETFQMIDLPTTLARHFTMGSYTCNIKGSLGILQFHENTNTYTVWMMEAGIQRSFTKLFTIQARQERIKGFRKSWVPIVEGEHFKLVVYEPNLEHSNALQIPGVIPRVPAFFKVHSNMETLLLLGRSDCSSH